MSHSSSSRKAVLMIGSLGVVYGDIGTSPLYALRECFAGSHGVAPTQPHVFGIVSLITWSMTLIVCIKYLGFVMRANNNGEGGILALLALTQKPAGKRAARAVEWMTLLAVVGAALLYGDGMITPAITVLSAVEGLNVAAPALQHYVVPVSIAIIVGLFSLQKHGTGKIGSVFGPIMLLWFLVLGVLGIRSLIQTPGILMALSPHHAVQFILEDGGQAFRVLGSVFLVVTGAEALYADMGHFGIGPIRRAWFWVAFPGLLLNYFGQGALLLRDATAAENPFYLLAPAWGVFGLTLLSTVAAVIASQAMIAGASSITMQAIQVGLLPRLNIRHTSHTAFGQIYIPQLNWMLMLVCVGLVLGFRSSTGLAGAYGIAVSMTMIITTSLLFAAVTRVWKWPLWLALPVCGTLFLVEATFVAANGLKLFHGGWIPLVIAGILSFLMLTWRAGRRILRDRLQMSYLPLDLFMKDMEERPLARVPGTAVFLSGNPQGTPIALLHNIKHNKVLHERVIILTVSTSAVPFIPEEQRVKVEQLRPDIFRLTGCYGFMEQPDIPRLLETAESHNLSITMMKSTFFLSRETVVSGKARDMALWRRWVFSVMSRNAQPATAFFNLPPNRVVELGMQVVL